MRAGRRAGGQCLFTNGYGALFAAACLTRAMMRMQGRGGERGGERGGRAGGGTGRGGIWREGDGYNVHIRRGARVRKSGAGERVREKIRRD